jgi:hypothetical protein
MSDFMMSQVQGLLAKVKAWLTAQAGAGEAPKAHAVVDLLLSFDKKN